MHLVQIAIWAKVHTTYGYQADTLVNVAAPPPDTTEGAIKGAVHRLRHRYRAAIREEIAETVDGAAAVEEELRHLLAVLSHG